MDLALCKDGLGFQMFNAVNDTNPVPQPNAELLAIYVPKVKLTRPVGEDGSLLPSRKVREVLGVKERHNWRGEVLLS